MPKRSDDVSPGDARQPYNDIGGVEARHAQTHDVRREELTNPQGIDHSGDEFVPAVMPATPTMELRTHADQSTSARDDKELQAQLTELTAEELRRLPVLETGSRLEQGGTYLDLNDRAQ